MLNPSLSPRLMAIATMVPHGARICDVGTDHAYLPIHLVLQGVIDFAIASDVNDGPVAKATRNVAAHNLCSNIHVQKADGLAAVAGLEGVRRKELGIRSEELSQEAGLQDAGRRRFTANSRLKAPLHSALHARRGFDRIGGRTQFAPTTALGVPPAASYIPASYENPLCTMHSALCTPCDTVVIAGMGADLICNMLTRYKDVAQKMARIIVQPMTSTETVREYLCKNGYTIYDESIAAEEDSYYFIMAARRGQCGCAQNEDYLLSPALISKKSDVTTLYIKKRIAKIDSILSEIDKKGSSSLRKQQLLNLRESFQKLLAKNAAV